MLLHLNEHVDCAALRCAALEVVGNSVAVAVVVAVVVAVAAAFAAGFAVACSHLSPAFLLSLSLILSRCPRHIKYLP